MNKEKLRSVIEDNTTFNGKVFDYIIQLLIFVSLIAFTIETLPNNSKSLISILNWIELISVLVFSFEYLIRIYVAKEPFKYVFSFYGIIDLFAILPFYLNFGLDLRSLRSFRIFRIFRALKIVRYNRALKRFGVAAKIVKEEVILFLIIIMIFIFIVSSGIYYFENEAQPESFKSIPHSFWWTIVTLTTVGYGDVYPITIGGKIFTFFVLLLGVAVVTVPAGLVATALSKARQLEDEIDNDEKELS
ncbi:MULTISPECIES: ion transporter [unclassified Flavobacterium]|uniref:ion transporter n=1 Tax=unclassified Flavobacterium TaxID=196869 RepID=UPI001291D04B|nr:MULTISPECIES: ion transporter [unclassified Flavobacterium]MQP53116.1 ion transporter [Flavobacterium sp. LMO9]MQP62757.1 ion transporter [Flavobacterium sp. LMO6]